MGGWKPLFRVWFLSAALAGGMAAQAQAQQLITNGGFEAGFAGWTRLNQAGGDGTFALQSGPNSPANGFPVPAPPEGILAAMTDAAAGGSHILYQDITIPANIPGGLLGFSIYLNSDASLFSPANLDFAATNRTGGQNLNQQARVDILTTTADPFSVASGDVLQNLFQTKPGDPLVSGYNSSLIDVSSLLRAHAGETLRLRFAETDNVSFFNFGVDSVGLQAVPEPSAWMLSGVMLTGLTWCLSRRSRKANAGRA